ncbi:AAA ATPase [Clostridium sp. DL-VIII]|uniref:ATP-binding protein n=1 Tax=Clostridium sp. DL-VIII TaxID=641107 RepID=UPI00023AFD57|nr:ATP-binding protein [Clostridium sp. DL-VIII]EHI98974.1 AAA ATPase [Clostridium sp. DL-VIII]
MKYASLLNKVIKIMEDSGNKNWIIIGDNSIGKSEVLRGYVTKNKEAYYIDSVNRGFDIRKVILQDIESFSITSRQIIDTRIKDEFYNLTDSFGGNDHIERLYPLYKDKLKSLFKNYLDVDFSIEREGYEEGYGEGPLICKIDNIKAELSSGYQALARIFSELIFYKDIIKEKGIIVIDEIDEFLSPKNSANILNFLISEFPGNNFIVSTHSGDLIANTNAASIIALEKENFSILDSNDFTTLTEVNTLFHKLFNNQEREKDHLVDDKLQRLFDLKIIGKWTEEEEIEFSNIDFNNLTSVQKLIHKQIEEW